MLLIDKSALARMKGGGLGAVVSAAATPAAAIAQVFPGGLTSQAVSTGPGGSINQANAQNVVQLIQQAASLRFIPWDGGTSHTQPWAFTCTGSGSAQASVQKATGIVSKAGGAVAGSAIAMGAAAGSVVPVVGTIIGVVAGLFSSLFAGLFKEYHAERWAAVCGAVPAANQVLQQIDQALASGQMTPDQARAQYQSLQSQFSSAMHVKSYGRPNLVWAFDMIMQVVIAARMLDLQIGVLTGGAAAPWATSAGIGGTVTIGGAQVPLWALAGGAALLAAAWLM